ncbi:putative reverse transcriptase domain-containing protein [Tanacetum coccineum]
MFTIASAFSGYKSGMSSRNTITNLSRYGLHTQFIKSMNTAVLDNQFIFERSSFFFTNNTGAPHGDELGRIKPFSNNSCSCLDNSFISDGAKRYGARVTGAAPGIRSIRNSTCLGGGSPVGKHYQPFSSQGNQETELAIEDAEVIAKKFIIFGGAIYVFNTGRLCGSETVHALGEKKGKAKDKYYGKLILDLGNEVHSSVEQGTTAIEKLVEKLGNAEDKVECKRLKKELREARIMPPKSAPMTQAAIRRMIKESIDVAIIAKRARQANVRNDASGSGLVRGRDTAPAVRECTFVGFMKCNPTGKKVKFAAATLEGPTLTWWKTKVATMGLETVNQMPWTEIKQLMTAEFCPIEEVQRMEHELWNLKVKEYDVVAYTKRFNELALMCPRMVEPERVKVDAYIWGLTDNIKGEVTSSKPADLNEAICMAHKLMEHKSKARDARILEGKKRKWENLQSGNSSGKGNQRDNSRQSLQNSQKQGNARAMVTAPTDRKLPLCERCFTRHVGQCTIKCHKCGKVGHKARYCKEKSVATGANAQPV